LPLKQPGQLISSASRVVVGLAASFWTARKSDSACWSWRRAAASIPCASIKNRSVDCRLRALSKLFHRYKCLLRAAFQYQSRQKQAPPGSVYYVFFAVDLLGQIERLVIGHARVRQIAFILIDVSCVAPSI
jgi:hypothetical protein